MKYLIICDSDLITKPFASAFRAINLALGLKNCNNSVALFSIYPNAEKKSYLEQNKDIIVYSYSNEFASLDDFYEYVINDNTPSIIIYRDRNLKTLRTIIRYRNKYNYKIIMDLGEDLWGIFLNTNWIRKNIIIGIYTLINSFMETLFIKFIYFNKIDFFIIINPKLSSRIPKRIPYIYIPQILSDYYSQGCKKASDFTKQYFVHIGTVALKKDDLLAIIKGFSKFINYNSKYKLFLIGQQSKRLISYINKYNITDHVVFIDYLSQQELLNLLNTSTFNIITQKKNKQNAYNFPTKLLQYILSGNLLVSSNHGILKAFLKDNYNCIIYETGNPQHIAYAFNRAIQYKQEDRIRLINNLQLLIKNNLSAELKCKDINKMVEDYDK
ncbi:MAG TPA: glycosyltransferase [Melioribacteraceae bacterium]|nr:glycosyltransferase [Melioribacteraceae bacterium]